MPTIPAMIYLLVKLVFLIANKINLISKIVIKLKRNNTPINPKLLA